VTIVPAFRPQITHTRAARLLLAHGVGILGASILGMRGYYRDTLGVPSTNDRGLYDDAIAVVSPRHFVTFNANTDPSRAGGRLASLALGVWHYQLGIHHPGTPGAYPALTQAAAVTVERDNGVTESGWFGINIHRGGWTTTSSEGCQTIHPSQWDEFIALVRQELDHSGARTIPYVLVEEVG
jgi:hypothetical protein